MIPVVVGSSPISHPTEYVVKSKGYMLRLVTLFLHFPTVFLIFQRIELNNGNATADCHPIVLVDQEQNVAGRASACSAQPVR